MLKHLKENAGKYGSVLSIFPLMFLANLAMPLNMSFATSLQVNETNCRLAWIEYESAKRKLDNATFRAQANPTDQNRSDITKYSIDVEKALIDINKYCI